MLDCFGSVVVWFGSGKFWKPGHDLFLVMTMIMTKLVMIGILVFRTKVAKINNIDMLSTRSGKKRSISAAPGKIIKRQFCDPELEPETDPKITIESDPSIIPFSLLAPLLCPGWMALTNPDKADGQCAIDAATRADPAKKCAPRMRACAMLFMCKDCKYGPTRGYHWTLDTAEQEAVFRSVEHHLGADIMQEMMTSMGSEASHLSIEYQDGFTSDQLVASKVAGCNR